MPTSAPIARRRKAGAQRLTDLKLGEVSVVDVPANTGARHVMFKNLAALKVSDAVPAGTVKGAAEESTAAWASRCADLQRRLLEKDQEIAALADRIAVLALMAAPAIAEKAATALAPPVSAFAKAEADLNAMAILAREGRTVTTRKFWHSTLVQLGQHVAPDSPPATQLARALEDPRGRDFLQAKMDAKS